MATYSPKLIFEGLKALKHKECIEDNGKYLGLIIRVIEMGFTKEDIAQLDMSDIEAAMDLIETHRYGSEDNIITSLQDVSMLKSVLSEYVPKKRIVCDTDFF